MFRLWLIFTCRLWPRFFCCVCARIILRRSVSQRAFCRHATCPAHNYVRVGIADALWGWRGFWDINWPDSAPWAVTRSSGLERPPWGRRPRGRIGASVLGRGGDGRAGGKTKISPSVLTHGNANARAHTPTHTNTHAYVRAYTGTHVRRPGLGHGDAEGEVFCVRAWARQDLGYRFLRIPPLPPDYVRVPIRWFGGPNSQSRGSGPEQVPAQLLRPPSRTVWVIFGLGSWAGSRFRSSSPDQDLRFNDSSV